MEYAIIKTTAPISLLLAAARFVRSEWRHFKRRHEGVAKKRSSRHATAHLASSQLGIPERSRKSRSADDGGRFIRKLDRPCEGPFLLPAHRHIPRNGLLLVGTNVGFDPFNVCLLDSSKMPPRRRYSFFITEAQAAGLKEVKDREHISESEQIRRAVDAWLDARGVLKPVQFDPIPGHPTEKPVNPASSGEPPMTLAHYLQKKTRRITPAESQAIRRRIKEGRRCEEIADELGLVPTQVSGVHANMKRGR